MSEQKEEHQSPTKLLPFDAMGHINPIGDIRALKELAESLPLPAVAVEVGAWAGSTTMMLADVGYRVFAVDHWEGSPDSALGRWAQDIGPEKVFMTFCRNMGPRLFSTIFPLKGSSRLWADAWVAWGPQIDLLYIDACHEYESVLEDITLWSPLVRDRGIIAGHDFGDGFPGVKRAVHETGPYDLVGECTWWRWKTGEKPRAA